MEVKIQLVDDNPKYFPVKGTDDAACYDLIAREITKITDGYYKVKLGIKSEIPQGYKMLIYPRSGITDTGWMLANSVGVIDSDYRGEWQARFRAQPNGIKYEMVEIDEECGDQDCEPLTVPTPVLTFSEFPYKVGERVAQTSLEKVLDYSLIGTASLSDTLRGEGGHGSTGK